MLITDPAQLPEFLREQLAALPPEEQAQVLELIRTEGLRVPAAALGGGGPGGATEVAGDPAAAAAMALLQQLSSIERISRSPAEVLRGLAQQMPTVEETAAAPSPEGEPPVDEQAPTGEALPGESAPSDVAAPPAEATATANPAAGLQDFQQKLIAGNWPAIGEKLAAMPEPIAQNVYTRVLQLLNGSGGILVPTDILALADASPTALTQDQLNLLGNLLGSSLQQVEQPTAFLAALESGSSRLGGQDPDGRAAAVQLLMAASLVEEAGKYLAPLEEVMASEDPAQLNLYARYLQVQLGGVDHEQKLADCWNLTQTVLALGEAENAGYSEALNRSLSLLPRLPIEQASAWIGEQIESNPRQGMQVLAALCAQVDMAYRQRAIQPRYEALEMLERVLALLVPAAAEDPETWRAATQLLAYGWMTEVQRSVGGSRRPITSEEQQIQPLPAEELFSRAPDDRLWEVVDPDTGDHLRYLSGLLAAQAVEKERCFAIAHSFLEEDPEVARRIVEQYFTAWAARQNGQQPMPEYYDAGMQVTYGPQGQIYYSSQGSMAYPSGISSMSLPPSYYGSSQSYRGPSIPLTRARQVRSLNELGEMIREVAAEGLPSLQGTVLVNVFEKCHSPAEIFRQEDIERVFGPVDEMPQDVALSLASTMRDYLAGQWRRPQLQQQYGTQRTDEELVAEVARGYELATRMLAAAAEAQPTADMLLAVAAANFDYAEFLYGQEVDLEIYIALRDRAFAAFRQAHELYAESLAGDEAPPHSARLYQVWFQSALGASDLAYLTRQEEPDRDQLEQLGDAIASLGEVSDEHLQLFGDSIVSSLNRMPAHLRPWCVREALKVLGDHPSGEPLQELSDFYADLLDEVELHVEIDGSAQIGQRPFGAHVYVRSTKAVERESGGFGQLVQAPYPGSGQENAREKLEQEIREKLGEGFEIMQLVFHEPTVGSRGFGREGWAQTPLAYLVLQAKEPAIDRIPSLQLDLSFYDGYNTVLLPIASQVELVDARTSQPAERPYSELEVTQTLDDRELAEEGKVRLEIAAMAKGLPPELPALLDLPAEAATLPEGFTVFQIEDHGLSIESLDTEGQEVRPVSRRNWLVTLTAAGETQPAEFRFPAVKAETTTQLRERYDDADIVEAGEVVELPVASLASSPRRLLVWGGVGLAAVVLGGVLLYVVRRKRGQAAATVRSYAVPDPLTPFTALALLKRIDSDPALSLSAHDHGELHATIGRLERRYFARANGDTGDRDGEFKLALEQWLPRAR